MFLPPILVAPTLSPPAYCRRCDVRWTDVERPCWSCGGCGVDTGDRCMRDGHRSWPEAGGTTPYTVDL